MKVATILTRVFFGGSVALMLGVFAHVPEAAANDGFLIGDGDDGGEFFAKCLDGNRQVCKNAELIYYWV